MEEAKAVKDCLQKFCEWSGQRINFGKSIIHFSRNVHMDTQEDICSFFQMGKCNHHSKYLGLPFCKGPSQRLAFEEIAEKVIKKLSGWKIKALSQAGRTTLIKSVVSVVPTYAMQSYSLPESICQLLERKSRDFWWGFKEDNRKHLYLKAWETVCLPKEASGLGIRKFADVNKAFFAKLG